MSLGTATPRLAHWWDKADKACAALLAPGVDVFSQLALDLIYALSHALASDIEATRLLLAVKQPQARLAFSKCMQLTFECKCLASNTLLHDDSTSAHSILDQSCLLCMLRCKSVQHMQHSKRFVPPKVRASVFVMVDWQAIQAHGQRYRFSARCIAIWLVKAFMGICETPSHVWPRSLLFLPGL